MNLKYILSFAFVLGIKFLHAQSLTIENGASVTVNGDGNGGTVVYVGGTVDVKSGGVLDINSDGKLLLGGNFIVAQSSSFDPGSGTVEFNGTGTTQLIQSSGTPFFERFYNCIINSSAGVEIDGTTNPLGVLYINNILTPQSGTLTTNGDLLLRSSATIQARLAYGTGTISGLARVEKQLNSEFADWRQMGFPVVFPDNTGNTNWDDFTNRLGILLDGYIPANRVNTFVWDASNSGTADYATGWIPATDQLDEANAFSIYLSNKTANLPYHYFGSSSAPQQFEIDGVLRQGDFNHNLEYSRDPADMTGTNPDAVGWNFVPNPWAAYVDVDVLLNDVINFTSGYKAIHVWDATNTFSDAGQYRAIVNGITKIDYNTNGADINGSGQNLDLFQGFWVKATASGQVCNLIASTMQTTDFQGERFLKKDFETIRLNVFDTDSLWDQLVIYFNETSTRAFDLEGDAYYLPSVNEEVPVLYALEGSSKASIVSRQPNITDSVEVAFGSAKEQSTFYLHADLDELPTDWYVYLRDKKTKKTYRLEHDKSLAFNHQYGLSSNRFVIYYSKNANAFEHLVTGEQAEVIASIKQNQLALESYGIGGTGAVAVFDAVGRLLYNQDITMTPGESLPLDLQPSGNLIIVDVAVNGEHYIQKVFF